MKLIGHKRCVGYHDAQKLGNGEHYIYTHKFEEKDEHGRLLPFGETKNFVSYFLFI